MLYKKYFNKMTIYYINQQNSSENEIKSNISKSITANQADSHEFNIYILFLDDKVDRQLSPVKREMRANILL